MLRALRCANGVAGSKTDSSAASAASAVFGLGVLLADIGLIGYRVLALRQRAWPTPFAALPLTLGLFQMLIVTPVSLAAGFTSTASFVVIAAADLLIAAAGVSLLRAPVTSEPLVHPQRAHPSDQRLSRRI